MWFCAFCQRYQVLSLPAEMSILSLNFSVCCAAAKDRQSDKFSRDLSAFSICLQKLATSTLAQFEWKRTWPHGPESLLLSLIIPFQKVLGCHELLNSVLARQSNQQRCGQMAGFQNATYAQGASLRSVENSLGQSSRAALLKPKESYLISMSRKAFLWEKDLRTKRVRVRWSLVVKAVTASRPVALLLAGTLDRPIWLRPGWWQQRSTAFAAVATCAQRYLGIQ